MHEIWIFIIYWISNSSSIIFIHATYYMIKSRDQRVISHKNLVVFFLLSSTLNMIVGVLLTYLRYEGLLYQPYWGKLTSTQCKIDDLYGSHIMPKVCYVC